MMRCLYCKVELPNTAPPARQTRVMKTSAYCSPICKIKNSVITIDPMGCWIYNYPAFTWGYKSFSVRGYLYMAEFGCKFAPEIITMECKSRNCANPDHMASYGRPRVLKRPCEQK